MQIWQHSPAGAHMRPPVLGRCMGRSRGASSRQRKNQQGMLLLRQERSRQSAHGGACSSPLVQPRSSFRPAPMPSQNEHGSMHMLHCMLGC